MVAKFDVEVLRSLVPPQSEIGHSDTEDLIWINLVIVTSENIYFILPVTLDLFSAA